MQKRFLMIFAALVFAAMMFVGIFNCIIDPYNVWNIYRRVGVNQWTPKAEDLDRLIQPILFSRVKPETVFLGNSQVIWGVDASEYTRLTGKSAYNFGMLGASIYEMRRNLEHAIAVDENLSEVYLCVNFDLFASNERHPIAQKKPEFDESQVGHSVITADNLAKTTFSYKALQDSIETIKDNHKNKYDYTYYTPTGRWDDKSIQSYCQKRKWTFNESMKIMARADYYYEDMSLDENCLEEMQRIVNLCQEHNIVLHVYTLPAHARSMENYASAWPVFEDWLKRLVKIAPVAFFSDYNKYTMSEAQNGILSENSNPYFWDSHHAKYNLCNIILAEMVSGENMAMGKILDEGNVDAYLSELTSRREAWELAYPESVEEVRYYTGFSQLTPLAVQGREQIVGHSIVRLDLLTGADKCKLSVSQNGMLDLTGERLTPIVATAEYAVLEAVDGKKYYTIAEPISNVDIAAFMHDRNYEMSGFHIMESLRKVEKGDYELYLLEIDENGYVYKSASMAEIKIN